MGDEDALAPLDIIGNFSYYTEAAQKLIIPHCVSLFAVMWLLRSLFSSLQFYHWAVYCLFLSENIKPNIIAFV